MYKFKLVLIILSLIFSYSCSKEIENVKLIKETDQKIEMISAYKEGMNLFEMGDYFASSKKFLEAEILLPQSQWAPKSVLMASYSYYMQNYYSEAITTLERYLKTYPSDKNLPYAHYLIAMCYYETIEDEKRDSAPLIKAKNKFDYIVVGGGSAGCAVANRLSANDTNKVLLIEAGGNNVDCAILGEELVGSSKSELEETLIDWKI